MSILGWGAQEQVYMCVKVVLSLLLEELWGFCWICEYIIGSGQDAVGPLEGQEEGLDLEMCNGYGVEKSLEIE